MGPEEKIKIPRGVQKNKKRIGEIEICKDATFRAKSPIRGLKWAGGAGKKKWGAAVKKIPPVEIKIPPGEKK